jgi:DNA-binding transcriptional regulator YdaS (Cro superfamily)
MAIEFLKEAVKRAGGQTALARALSTTERKLIQGNVQKWLNSPNPDRMPPAEYCPAIERLFGIRCEDMRPDVDWDFLRRTCRQKKAA